MTATPGVAQRSREQCIPPPDECRAQWVHEALDRYEGSLIRYALRLARRSPEGRYFVPYFGDGKIAVFDAAGTHDSGKRRGFQSTWRRRDPVFSLPLDHILHGPGLEAIDRWIGPALGSDHRAVVVTLRSR